MSTVMLSENHCPLLTIWWLSAEDDTNALQEIAESSTHKVSIAGLLPNRIKDSKNHHKLIKIHDTKRIQEVAVIFEDARREKREEMLLGECQQDGHVFKFWYHYEVCVTWLCQEKTLRNE